MKLRRSLHGRFVREGAVRARGLGQLGGEGDTADLDAHHHQQPTERLRVTCWCERRYVFATAAEVWEGLTRSCGLAECRPPVQRRAAG